jgi:dTDP-4-dehydrorhamnose reductase
MKILITGHLGQLATDLKSVLAQHSLILTELEDLPLQDEPRVLAFVQSHHPGLILNCAAYNRVDEAEDSPSPAFAANTFAPRNLALAARACNATLVHFSTDYVFDGDATRTGPYTEDDAPCPRSVYGISKLAGELMVQSTWHKSFICRVCGLYGYAGSRDKGSNFVETMIALARQGKPLKVVADQFLTPTSTLDIAQALPALVASGKFGLYHMTSAGQCSWHEFARAIFLLAGIPADLTPVDSSVFPTKAKRPAFSVLDNHNLRAAGLPDLPHWRDSLKTYIEGRVANGRA